MLPKPPAVVPPVTPPAGPVADYVVVGAGAAGALLANRLARRAPPGTTVLLLEAGERHLDDPNILNPLGTFGALNVVHQGVAPSGDPKYSWQAALERDTGRYGAREVVANGRQWGGGGAVNTMALVVGGKTVFDQNWPAGWHYADLVPYIAQIMADIAPYRDPVKLLPTQVYLDALQRLAAAQIVAGGTNFLTNVATGPTTANVENPDPAAPQLDYNDLAGIYSVCGFSAYQFFINQLPDGTFIRKWSGNTYLNAGQVDPVTGRGIGPLAGLTVVSNAWANRAVFGGPPGSTRATGVVYTDADGESHTATARREVIVAGGAFQSPAFLQRSGVGDPSLLEMIGVPVVANNPQVGLNLHNDYSPLIGVHVLGAPADVAAFMQTISVIQPGNLGYHGGAYLNFHPLEPNKPADYQAVSYRKYQVFLFGSTAFLPAAAQFQYNLPASGNNSLLFAMDDLRFSPSGSVQAPLTATATDTPNIFYNTLVQYTPTTAPPDAQWPAVQTTMAATISAILGLDIINQIVQQMNAAIVARGLNVTLQIGVPSPTTLFDELSLGLATYGSIWWHYLVPSLVYGNSGTPEQVAFANALAQLAFFARTVAHIDSHQMGSNAIGAAIDSNLRVVGTSNVRVGDLSATPQAPGGNTAFPAMVIGAVAADRILGLGPV